MSKRQVAGIGLGLVVCLLLGAAALKPKSAQPASAIRIVELSGAGADLGRQHGQRLGEEIRMLHEQYLGRWFGNADVHRRALAAAEAFRAQLRPEHRSELDALAAAASLGVSEAMLANCFLDILPSTACSTISVSAQSSPDAVARLGRNLDFPSMDVADKHSILLIYRPKGAYAFGAVGWPGLIGVLSGMNEHGLVLANMEVRRGPVLPRAMPYTLLYRTVLEKCRTVDEAIELLKATPRQSANNLMLMDAEANRAVVELTPQGVVVRRPADNAALISTNHQRGQDQDTAGYCRRYDSLHDAARSQAGSIDEPVMERMLANAAQGRSTMQYMVFEPANRVIYLALGANAPSRKFERIDLAQRFNAAAQ